jgi:hypothetical protein
MQVLLKLLNNRKTIMSSRSRSNAAGCFSLLQPNYAIRWFCFGGKLSYGSISIQFQALLDSGASTCFIDIAFIHAHNIPIIRTSQPIRVESIDRRVRNYSIGASSRVPPGDPYVLSHCIPPASCCLGIILVGDTQPDSGEVPPLNHLPKRCSLS